MKSKTLAFELKVTLPSLSFSTLEFGQKNYLSTSRNLRGEREPSRARGREIRTANKQIAKALSIFTIDGHTREGKIAYTR